MDMDKKIAFAETIFAQEVDGEMVLLDMGTENYFGLNGVGTDIWELLQTGKTLQETEDAMLEMYDVEAEVLHKELLALVQSLLDNDLASVAS